MERGDFLTNGFSWSLGKDRYSQMLRTAVITRDPAKIRRESERVAMFRKRYEDIGQVAKCPWWLVAVLHMRENNNDFRGVLHNGERIIGTGRKTRLVPKNRGPFATFEESAVDALKIQGIHLIKTWDVERSLGFIERYNGMGYYRRGVPSPYLWNYTSHYSKGKYTYDGVYDPTVIDQQIGCVAILIEWRNQGVFLEGIMKHE